MKKRVNKVAIFLFFLIHLSSFAQNKNRDTNEVLVQSFNTIYTYESGSHPPFYVYDTASSPNILLYTAKFAEDTIRKMVPGLSKKMLDGIFDEIQKDKRIYTWRFKSSEFVPVTSNQINDIKERENKYNDSIFIEIDTLGIARTKSNLELSHKYFFYFTKPYYLNDSFFLIFIEQRSRRRDGTTSLHLMKSDSGNKVTHVATLFWGQQ